MTTYRIARGNAKPFMTFDYINKLQRELDAAISDLNLAGSCRTCLHWLDEVNYIPNTCLDCTAACNYEWRGPCETGGGERIICYF